MAEQPQYGATDDKTDDNKNKQQDDEVNEQDPLIKSSKEFGSRIPIAIGLDNEEWRAITFGILLFTFCLPSLVYIAIDIADGICTGDYCKIWLTSYCCIIGGMAFYELSVIDLWYKKFGRKVRESLFIKSLRKICGCFIGVGSILLLAAVADDLTNREDKIGFFGIHLFPILTGIALSFDILIPRFGDIIRVRCSVISGIIFIASLLIVIDIFDENWSFSNSVDGVYEIGWLLTCISSCAIHGCCVTGLCNYVKKNNQTFLALDYIAFAALFSGVSLSMCYTEGYIAQTRTGYLIFAECSILCIEIFML